LPNVLITLENYFNYFTEIEEHFQRRRGTLTLLSPLDWALMEVWKDAGIPLEAVIRGIDSAFDKYERRPRHTRKVNGLAYCAQEVLFAAEDMKEAAVGGDPPETSDSGWDAKAVSEFLRRNAEQLRGTSLPDAARRVAAETTSGLREMAAALEASDSLVMEDIERRLTVMEEKLLAALVAEIPEAAWLEVRTDADRDLAPYRSRMSGPQIEQLQKQYVQKRLLEQYRLPRLSLFYMS
jgi:hypothetical protein